MGASVGFEVGAAVGLAVGLEVGERAVQLICHAGLPFIPLHEILIYHLDTIYFAAEEE